MAKQPPDPTVHEACRVHEFQAAAVVSVQGQGEERRFVPFDGETRTLVIIASCSRCLAPGVTLSSIGSIRWSEF